MNDRTPCATPEALVTYLYEECDPAERQSIAAHVATCAVCSAEVEALSDTRAHLASWSPPALPLGFQVTRTESDQPAKVLDFGAAVAPKPRSGEGGWWKQPLPAWAQAAAAVLIFAAGMSVNVFRSGDEPTAVAAAPPTQPVTVAADTRTDDLSVTREEFARLESRLRAMERADVSRASYAPGADRALDSDDVRAELIALKSRVAEDRKVYEFFRDKVSGALTSNRADINAMREATQQIPLIDRTLQDHREAIVAVGSGLAVRTALTSSGR